MSDSCKKKWIVKVDNLLSKGEKGDKGDPGEGAELILPLSSDDVLYETTSQTLTDVIDSLLYTALVITGFSASPSTYEKGQTLTSVSLSWSFNKTIQSQTITGTNVISPTLLVGDRNKIVSLNNITTNTTITLTADDVTSDAIAAKTSALTLQFLNKIYWGKGAIPGVLNSAFILALSNSELRSNRLKSFTITANTNEYIFFALPVAYGVPSFKTNGFNGGFQLEGTITFTNASGWAESYNVYRSTNHTLGTTFVEVL